MNISTFIVKLISVPKQCLIDTNISVVESQAQFPNTRKKNFLDQFKIVTWGDLSKELLNYYTIGDYIIIQGILSFEQPKIKNQYKKETKFTVINLYPFLLVD